MVILTEVLANSRDKVLKEGGGNAGTFKDTPLLGAHLSDRRG